jgi:hypothetical protein
MTRDEKDIGHDEELAVSSSTAKKNEHLISSICSAVSPFEMSLDTSNKERPVLPELRHACENILVQISGGTLSMSITVQR